MPNAGCLMQGFGRHRRPNNPFSSCRAGVWHRIVFYPLESVLDLDPMMNRILLLAMLPVIGCASGPGRAGYANLIVHHAKIITVDPDFSIAEAIAIKDGRIVA